MSAPAIQEFLPQIDKGFKDLCDIIVKTTEEIVPKRKIKKRKPKLQIMSEDILKSHRTE
jgi:hypothetical protein